MTITTRTTILLMILVTSLEAMCAGVPYIPVSKLDIRVFDDHNVPVAAASVAIGCWGGKTGLGGVTDTNGLIRYEERIVGSLACEVTKPGYYKTYGELWGGPSSGGLVPPTTQYTVILKKLENLAPMLKREIARMMPAGLSQCGLDLEVGDWVAPYGKGTVKDLLISMAYTNSLSKFYEKQQILLFPTPNDGIIPLPRTPGWPLAVRSDLPVPQLAPSTGYTNEWSLVQSRRDEETRIDSTVPHEQYLFRVRAQTNAAGEIVKANVGWITHGFNLSGPQPLLRFQYYFNPDPTSRSLEPEKF